MIRPTLIILWTAGCTQGTPAHAGAAVRMVRPAVPVPKPKVPPPVVPTPRAQPDGIVCAPSPDLALCSTDIAAVASGRAFSTIGSAIDSGAPVVSVCPGTHVEQLALEGIVLQSASGTPSDTILSGRGAHQILEAKDAQVMGLSFIDGHSDYAGGAIEGKNTSVACSVFENNIADYQGGALQLRGDSTISGTVFRRNSAGYEGGAISWGERRDRTLSIHGSTFEQNTADYSGGAIEIGTWGHDTVSISSSTFTGNSDGHDVGVVAFGSWGGFDGRIDHCIFTDNDQAIGLTGHLRNGHTLSVTDSPITGHRGDW